VDPITIVNLALDALTSVLNIIAEIKGTAGLTDAQVGAAALTAAGGNDTLYAQLMATLGLPIPPA
jgi:hypothetical protein